MDITRRALLVGGVASSLATIASLENLVLFSPGATEAQEPKLSVEELIKSRQNELENLAKSPYANVVYDHYRTFAKKAVRSSPYRIEYEQIIDSAVAITESRENTFGLGSKTTIYIFKEFFEQQEINSTKGRIILKPTLERKRVQLEGELGHAEDNYTGIILENGLPINSSNYRNINSIVLKFIRETRGYLRQLELSRKIENPSTTDLEEGKFEKLPPGYFSTLVALLQHLHKLKPDIDKIDNYSPLEREYVRNQLNQISLKAPEIFKLKFFK